MADIAKVHANMAGWYPDIITDLAEITPGRAFCSYGPLGMGAGEVLIADVIEIVGKPEKISEIRYKLEARLLFSSHTRAIVDPPSNFRLDVVMSDHTIWDTHPLYGTPFLIPYVGTNPEPINALNPLNEPTV